MDITEREGVEIDIEVVLLVMVVVAVAIEEEEGGRSLGVNNTSFKAAIS